MSEQHFEQYLHSLAAYILLENCGLEDNASSCDLLAKLDKTWYRLTAEQQIEAGKFAGEVQRIYEKAVEKAIAQLGNYQNQ